MTERNGATEIGNEKRISSLFASNEKSSMKTLLSLLTTGLFLSLAIAQTPDDSTVPLFDFRQSDVRSGWHINIFKDHPDGGRGHVTFEPFDDPERGSVVQLTSETAGRFNVVSPEIALPEHGDPLGFQIEYRTGETTDPLALIVCDNENNIYSAPLPPTLGTWETRTITNFPNSQKGTPPLDLQKLRKIYIRGAGNVDISIASIRLVVGEREIPLSSISRPILTVPNADAPPVLDGKLDDPAWENAAVISDLPTVIGTLEKENYPTKIRILRSGERLWLGAWFGGEPEPNAESGRSGGPVWKDSSLEVSLKPDLKDGPVYQLIVNSLNNRQNYKNSDRSWKGSWESAVSKEKDGWTIEMEIDLGALDPGWNENSLWRWNVVRNVTPSNAPAVKNPVALRAGLFDTSNPMNTRSALLSFAPVADDPGAKNFSLIKTGPSEYALNLPTAQKKTLNFIRAYKVEDDGSESYAGETTSSAKLELRQIGLYRLEVESGAPGESRIALLEFFANNPAQTRWDDVVLWPSPQKLGFFV